MVSTRHSPNDTTERVFDFVVDYKRQNDGNSPSARDILRGCNLSTVSLVMYHLRKLDEAERIQLVGSAGQARSICVIGGKWEFQSGGQGLDYER